MLSEKPIRVLLADDHVVVRMGLRSMVESDSTMVVVGEAANGEEALERYRHLRPDVVLMDLRMPRVGGVEAISAICAADPRAHILVLTTYDGDESIYQALKSGAHGYLLKDVAKEEFLLAVEKGQEREDELRQG